MSATNRLPPALNINRARKARLMIICLVLLGLANILGAMATSFPLLFATRILAGIGSGGVFPLTAAAIMVALGIACARLLRQTRPADARPS